MNLSRSGKCTRVMDSVSAGTSDQNSTSVDMLGYESVEFIACFGAIVAAAVTSTKLQTSSDDSNWNDLLDTAIVIADDDDTGCVISDLSHPRERYIRMVVDRGTQNSTIDSIVAIQYQAAAEPVTHDSSTVISSEFHHAPAEGTA